ncbi:MAG: phosphate acyltransferase PlsX [Chlamydiae bacterium]|nr:phosphate acyltransferase PlsX [Chlamydiota bacterium]
MHKASKTCDSDHTKPRIGVDLLGSDTPAIVLLQSVLFAHKKLSDKAEFFLFVDNDLVLADLPQDIHTVIVSEIITMEDPPLSVLRKKKNSSIGKGMQMLKDKQIDAFISLGNSGAILAAAKNTLKTLKGIQRPALMTLIPAKGKQIAVLDVGASTQCKPHSMIQFAQMGIAYKKSLGTERPTVGLLNIGSEEKKGTPDHQKAYLMLQKLNETSDYPVFLGNIEGRDVFEGPVDVLVTDGFTGNVFLKTAEGTASFLLSEILQAMDDCAIINEKQTAFISSYQKKLDYAEYPGAILCGVQGIVMKCHGASQGQSLTKTIESAIELSSHDFLKKILSQLTA